MAKETARPAGALREYSTQLEAAITLTLAEPKKGAVHKLRSLSRRLEGQLQLLQQTGIVSRKSKASREFARRLRKLRRAAAEVRDLDVQHDLLEAELTLPREAADELRQILMQVRERKAAKLQASLTKQLPQITAALEGLMKSLNEATETSVPSSRVIPLIERWARSQEGRSATESSSDEELHTARKIAKLARYMAESVEDSPAAVRAAATFEAQQEAGGRWHDWLDLATTARKHFGKKHALTQAARDQCAAARTEYMKLIA